MQANDRRDIMKVLKPAPANRTLEQLYNHYLVEKTIAEKLKKSTREERKSIYNTMYDELFDKVPDHPRLKRRQSRQLTLKANQSKYNVIKKFLNKSSKFLEFAPGDCRFAFKVAERVEFAYGVDISDQCNIADCIPDNFNLVIYDGYNLDQIETDSIDVVFSDQLIEHLHPEDTKFHFELVFRVLKTGGKYIFRTPHLFSGPHDISQFFSYEPECFHLKEWTFIEIKKLIMELGYSKFQARWSTNRICLRMPYIHFALCELILSRFPKKHMRSATRYLIPSLCGIAVK